MTRVDPPTPRPPRLARRVLNLLCPRRYREEIAGDLDELFVRRVETVGAAEARRRYRRDDRFPPIPYLPKQSVPSPALGR